MATLVAPEFAPPEIREHDGILVVRDDLLEGGSKVRVAPQLLTDEYDEYVFAGPRQGYAQLALAIACEMRGKRGVFFTAQSKEPHPLTLASMRHGLHVVQVPLGRLSNVRAKARAYVATTGGFLADMGLKLPGMEDALYELALTLHVQPEQVWVTAGSGTLCSALARAWPDAEINAVVVGMHPRLPARAVVWEAPEAFHERAAGPLPPFPSAECYDEKAWRFVSAHAQPGALFWNVGA